MPEVTSVQQEDEATNHQIQETADDALPWKQRPDSGVIGVLARPIQLRETQGRFNCIHRRDRERPSSSLRETRGLV